MSIHLPLHLSAKTLKLGLGLTALALSVSACSITTVNNSNSVSIGSPASSNYSVFLSTNYGQNWRVMDAIPTTGGQTASINGLDVNVMRLDPEDNLAVYLASFNQGLYYTYDINNGWNPVASLPTATVNDVQIDPQNKCLVYAALANRLYQSRDCTRSWTQVYFDSNPQVSVNTIAIDYANSHNIYIGTSRGEIIKSIDSGNSWRTIHRLDSGVARLIISPLNSGEIFIATVRNQIFSFTSPSQTNPADTAHLDQYFALDNWTDMNAVLADYNLGPNFKDIIANPRDGTIFLATDKLILRSPDQGITWENLKLIQPETDTIINAIAVNPQNSADIYYVTNTTLFRSTDGGVTWKTQSLPSGRAGRTLLIDFKNPNNIYLGTMKLKN